MGSDSRVLITGATGQVGRELLRLSPDASAPRQKELDVTCKSEVADAVVYRDVVVHLAAYTGVDGCEMDSGRAVEVNDRGTAHIARACAEHGSYLIYVSTDYVFDGTKVGEYSESDVPNPINTYGRTKLAGEEHVLAGGDGLVVRTSTVYGQGSNFARSILQLLASGRNRLKVVDDQVSRPTAAADLAVALRWAVDERPGGLLNIAGSGMLCSRAELAAEIVRLGGFHAYVEPISTEEYEASQDQVVARRPRNSVLSLERAEELGVPLFDQGASLKAYVEGLL